MVTDLKFPFIRHMNDIIETNMFQFLLRGFCDEINQAIIFVSSIDDNYFIPDDKELMDFTCTDCKNYIRDNACRKIRNLEILNYQSKKETISLYLCTNGYGGLHLDVLVQREMEFRIN